MPNIPTDWRELGIQAFAAWNVTRAGATAIHLAMEPATVGLSQLQGHWPVDLLATKRILVVGTGSIGGAVATKLAAYGVGTLGFMDPDRLLWHNTVRHVLGPEHVGRRKVDALADVLTQRWPGIVIERHRLDVVTDADQARTIFPAADLIICAADGIAPRRVVSHLARRARKPAILTCVLDNGSIGEILRLRPGRNSGCLLCQRSHLAASNAIDPEFPPGQLGGSRQW